MKATHTVSINESTVFSSSEKLDDKVLRETNMELRTITYIELKAPSGDRVAFPHEGKATKHEHDG